MLLRPFFSLEKAELDNKYNCKACGLDKGCRSPRMDFTGKGYRKALIIAESPGELEDEQGTQLVGPAGTLFRQFLAEFNLDLDIDFWKINSINCRPPGNRKPSLKELSCCKRTLVKPAIDKLKPKFIWLLGEKAVESFYLNRFSDCSISRWRRLCIPDKETGAWVIPMYHPSYLLHNKDTNLAEIFKRDIKFAVSCFTKKPPVFIDYEKQVEIVKSHTRAMECLFEAKEQKVIAFDYETTNLKPQSANQKVWSIGVGWKDRAFAIPYSYPHWNKTAQDEIAFQWQAILKNPRIRKVAHGADFENMWSRVIFDVPKVNNLFWCTKNAAHLVSARKRYPELKFLSYVLFGVEGYGKEAAKYMKAKAATNINTLDKLPLDKLLLYNGLDALLTYTLFETQCHQFSRGGGKLLDAYNITHDGMLALSDAQITGIQIDSQYYTEQDRLIIARVTELEQEILNSDEVKEFKKLTGRELNIKKNISPVDMRIVLFDILKLEPVKFTPSGNQLAVDVEVLESLDSGFTKKVVERSKLSKLSNTYIAQFMREVVNGRIHPFCSLHKARSFRSSMNAPNIQNIPRKDEESKAIIRKGIIPSPGNKIACIDYARIEVCILACCTHDKMLIDYVADLSNDMHRDQGGVLFAVDKLQVTPSIRAKIKNLWVFPQFYGSYYVSCARDMWRECMSEKLANGRTVKQHLAEVGIISARADDKRQHASFENHVRVCEQEFWETFRASREWQLNLVKFYTKHGYVELLTGHRREGYMSRNMVFNTPVQGTAFMCLLWSFSELNKTQQAEQWKTRLVGQIHDEILYDLDPSEEEHVFKTTRHIMTEAIKSKYDWLSVPLAIEVEATPVDQAWYYKKGVELSA